MKWPIPGPPSSWTSTISPIAKSEPGLIMVTSSNKPFEDVAVAVAPTPLLVLSDVRITGMPAPRPAKGLSVLNGLTPPMPLGAEPLSC